VTIAFGVPVKLTATELPAHADPPPPMLAVGFGRTVKVASPEGVSGQFALDHFARNLYPFWIIVAGNEKVEVNFPLSLPVVVFVVVPKFTVCHMFVWGS
jgi:hypothetical protein